MDMALLLDFESRERRVPFPIDAILGILNLICR